MAREFPIERRTSLTPRQPLPALLHLRHPCRRRQLLPALPYLRHPCRRHITPRACGFTLIEVLVVVLLMVIVLGMVGLKLGGNDGRAVRQEANRLEALLLAAQQEAILQGQELALAPQTNGYEFQKVDEKNELAALPRDAMLRARELPEHMAILSLTLDGVAAEEGARIVMYPTGELSQAFVITLGLGEARWQVEGALDGTIKVSQPNV